MKLFLKTLEEDLRSELSGHFLKGCLALLQPTDEYEATCLMQAMKGLGTNEKVMIELLCTKNCHEIRHMQQVFKKRNRHTHLSIPVSRNFEAFFFV